MTVKPWTPCRLLATVVWGMALAVARASLGAAAAEEARQILETARVKGGLIVHFGCGDGKLTAALRVNDRFLVHGLDADAKNVDAARKHIQSLGLYGSVSVEHWTGERLPYADNLVNLLVCEYASAAGGERVSESEVLRVLAPGGVALSVNPESNPPYGGPNPKLVKPRPKELDEWTHFLHDAGNNAVARDTAVGAPRLLQWMAPPLWLRSHETPSGFQALVCGGGRVFYILDEGLIGITDQRLPERWALVCRDAFNGKLLWRRPLGPWGWPEWAADRFKDKDWTTITGARTAVPDVNHRRLVAESDRLYATLSYNAPLSILDAATGEILHTVKDAAAASEMVAADGIVVVLSRESGPAGARQKGGGDETKTTLLAVRGDSASVLWKQPTEPVKPLFLALDRGRVIYQARGGLIGLKLANAEKLWQVEPAEKNGRTLVAHEGVVVILGQNALEARDGGTGALLWHKQVPLEKGMGSEDLFVVNGVVWPSIISVDENQKPKGKSPHALAAGYDLRTGAERKRIFVENLRSPEHHHRCHRNKATERYLISSLEGIELLDLQGNGHSQSNFVRGVCKYGILPANGLLYVPPDQCFCEPGAKLLGFAAVAGVHGSGFPPGPIQERLERGPAFAAISNLKSQISDDGDWPTYRHDAARHGSTAGAVPAHVGITWRVKLGGALTAPVAAGGRVYVAASDAHTLHALEASTGKPLWQFIAGGRIDSPPTLHRGLVLFGSADGGVYCLRAEDGALAWRFLAAPTDRRIGCFDQIESAWPVHGSVLVRDGIAYFTAGRSTYLDGGIRVYGLDPLTGKLLRQTTLEGPFPDGKTWRELSFHIPGANSDILVSEGGFLYMRQKKLTPALEEVKADALSTKGEADVGLHVFSTSGLLDGSWYNRAFWMYSRRWPGFKLANQASKSGQLLVVDDQRTYGVNPFYRRNVHSPMFFPGKEGPRKLHSPAFGQDKGIGYTRAEPPLWTLWVPVRIRAMVKAGDVLFVAGPPDVLDKNDPYASFEGRKGASLWAVSAGDGKKLAEIKLDVPPVFDGLIAAHGRLYFSTTDGSMVCLGEK